MIPIKTAVILLGEYNPLITVCGEPIITRHILRCKTFGIEKIFILGHFTPEVLEYLMFTHSTTDQSIVFQYSESPWLTVYNERIGDNALIISCEHFTDIQFLEDILKLKPDPDNALMIGDTDATEISTVRPRILLTKLGRPVDLIERAKGEAVWMGLTLVGQNILYQLSQRKGEISPITIKQANMISQYGNCKLVKAKAKFWDRIDSSLIGSDISQEVLYYSNSKRNFIGLWESGISHVITNMLNFNRNAIIPIYICLIIFSFYGGWLLSEGTEWFAFFGLLLTLAGLLLGRTIQEINDMHLVSTNKMTGSQIIAARVSALGIFCGFFHHAPAIHFSNIEQKLTFFAILMLFVVSIVEASKYTVSNKLEQAPEKYHNAGKKHKILLQIFNLHWIWYCYPIFFAFNLFVNYFSLFIIEIYFCYLIILLQLPKQKSAPQNNQTDELTI